MELDKVVAMKGATSTKKTSKELPRTWIRPSGDYHAHFDCFSGAAGDMMLAACLDAADPSLLPIVQSCLEEGLPELKGEFSVSMERVWRSDAGCIAANYVSVHSKYDHAAAPLPHRDIHHDHHHHHDHGHDHHHIHSHHGADSAVEYNDHHTSHDDSNRENEKNTNSSCSENSGSVPVKENDQIHGPIRNLPQIRKMLASASIDYIPEWVKSHAIAAFSELAKAEAYTHGAESPDSVSFHEVGAIDSIVDTVGTCLALYFLGVTTVSCSRLPLGEGVVWTQHGLLPVPAPATLRLVIDMPTCPGPGVVTGELVTPTAAALLKVLTQSAASKASHTKRIIPGRPPCFTIRRIGIGAGTKDFAKHPNIIRLLIGDEVLY